MKGPIILIANLLTEGRGMLGFTAADAVARIEEATGRKVDVVITNMKWPSPQVLGRYAQEHKEPLAPGQRCRSTASWSAENSGPARSPGTIACGSRTRSGACCRSACSRTTKKEPRRPQRSQSAEIVFVWRSWRSLRCSLNV